MASYQIEIKPSASKELEKLPRQIIPRIVAAIKELADNPYPQGVKKLTGFIVSIVSVWEIIESCITFTKTGS